MTAEQTLVDFLDRLGCDSGETVRELLDIHAHELAEKQRAERDRQYGPLEFKAEKIAINHVIDHIDPEAQT